MQPNTLNRLNRRPTSVIPDYAKMTYFVRAPSWAQTVALRARVNKCFECVSYIHEPIASKPCLYQGGGTRNILHYVDVNLVRRQGFATKLYTFG
jgi:hypothetical protein